MSLKKILDNNKILFALILFFGVCLSFMFFIPSYNFDGYCQLSDGFFSYSKYFFGGGRPITGLIWLLFSFLNLSHDFVSVLAQLLSLLFQTLSVLIIYNQLKKTFDDNNLVKIICLVGSILLVFNPFIMDFYIYEESFCMFLSLLFSILAAKNIIKNKYFISFLFLLGNVFLYQGTLCVFFPLVLLFLVFENRDVSLSEFIKKNIWKIVIAGILYCFTLIAGFLSIKVYNIFAVEQSSKTGYINIGQNIKIIFNLLYISLKYLQGMFDPLIFKILLNSLFLLYLFFISFDLKNNYNKIVYILVLTLVSIFICFVPNLAMSTDANYTAPRMLISMGMLFGFVFLMSLVVVDFEKRKDSNLMLTFVLFTGVVFLYVNSCNYINNSMLDYQRYNYDRDEVYFISYKIKEYEKGNNKKIEKVYFYNTNLSGNFYDSEKISYYLSRVKNNYWALECLIEVDNDVRAYSVNLDYIEEKINIKIKENEIKEDQYYFVDDILYLILY